jgi:hypothetical protein
MVCMVDKPIESVLLVKVEAVPIYAREPPFLKVQIVINYEYATSCVHVIPREPIFPLIVIA